MPSNKTYSCNVEIMISQVDDGRTDGTDGKSENLNFSTKVPSNERIKFTFGATAEAPKLLQTKTKVFINETKHNSSCLPSPPPPRLLFACLLLTLNTRECRAGPT
jgi:hypothetical protein